MVDSTQGRTPRVIEQLDEAPARRVDVPARQVGGSNGALEGELMRTSNCPDCDRSLGILTLEAPLRACETALKLALYTPKHATQAKYSFSKTIGDQNKTCSDSLRGAS